MILPIKYNKINRELESMTDIDAINKNELIKKCTSLKNNCKYYDLSIVVQDISDSKPSDNDLKCIVADWARFQMNYALADSIYSDILAQNPSYISALNGKALIALDFSRISESLNYLQNALKVCPTNTETLLNLAEATLKNRDNAGYLQLINKVLEIEPLNSDALAGMGMFLCMYNHDIAEGSKYLLKALKSNPLNSKANYLLGRGYSPATYDEDSTNNSQLILADSLLRENRFKEAQNLILTEHHKDSVNLQTLKLIAATEYHLGNYYKCIDYSLEILRLKPNYGLAHYYIAEALTKLKDEHNVLIQHYKMNYSRKTAPAEIPYLKEVFINFEQCDEDLKKVIRLNVQPFKDFMEPLYVSGATIYFKDLHHLLWNCPFLQDSKGTRSIDQRLVDDLGGQGGYHMSSEKVQQKDVMSGKYNVAFHEFGHLIHWLFTPEQNRELKHLFIKAKKGKYTLDWYADSNEREYFAQGVEAYLSDYKLPGLPAAFANTKADLLKRDPDLLNFIERLTTQKSYQEQIVQAFCLKAKYLDSLDEAMNCLKNALKLFPEHPVLLIELGNLYRENSSYDEAIQIHRSATIKYPDNIHAVVELSYDLYLKSSNTAESISLLESMSAKITPDAELLSFLGYYYSLMKDRLKARYYLERSLELDPWPDPYSFRIFDAKKLLEECD